MPRGSQQSPAQRNVDIVRRVLESFNSRSGQEMSEHVDEFYDPEVSIYPVGKWPASRPSHGSEEAQRFLADFRGSWDQVELRIKKLGPVGDGQRVLVLLAIGAVGRSSGVELAGDEYVCYWLRHGRIFREEHHLTLGGALRSLGLEGESLEDAGLDW